MLRTALFAGCIGLSLGLAGQSRRVDLEAADCSTTYSNFDRDYETAHAVRHTTVPLTVGRLDVHPDANGGVRIERGTGRDYSITACIAASSRNVADAQAAADSVRLEIDGSRVRATAPDGDRLRNWSVQLVIAAPAGADVSVETQNGPIALDDVSGRFGVRAQNGPISVRGGQGEIDVETQNGPISIELSGRRWDGHLTARASNGPLSVTVPEDYTSGVEISSSQHAPWSCARSACSGGNRDWDDRARSLRLGSDPVVVKVSTNNGPVSVSR
jgi:DUF4097 and DUF4098 domain-containing protein YvlB